MNPISDRFTTDVIYATDKASTSVQTELKLLSHKWVGVHILLAFKGWIAKAKSSRCMRPMAIL